MRKTIKNVLSLLLIFAMVISTVILAPKNASAAIKSKIKTATLTVTDTKISGFKTIKGTVKVGKYVVAYGTDKKNENVYSYSTDGKEFIKAKKLGLSGKVSYQISGKNLYVISGSNPLNSYYKWIPTAPNMAYIIYTIHLQTNGKEKQPESTHLPPDLSMAQVPHSAAIITTGTLTKNTLPVTK